MSSKQCPSAPGFFLLLLAIQQSSLAAPRHRMATEMSSTRQGSAATGTDCNCAQEFDVEIGQMEEQPVACEEECGLALSDALADLVLNQKLVYQIPSALRLDSANASQFQECSCRAEQKVLEKFKKMENRECLLTCRTYLDLQTVEE